MDDGLSILQYADDTIIFMENNLEQAKNIELLLCAFEQFSGLKINIHKSELFCYEEARDFQGEFSRIFGCDVSNLPFQYLSIPMWHKRLRNMDLKHVEEISQKD